MAYDPSAASETDSEKAAADGVGADLAFADVDSAARANRAKRETLDRREGNACVRVCVCVCVRERERERESASE